MQQANLLVANPAVQEKKTYNASDLKKLTYTGRKEYAPAF